MSEPRKIVDELRIVTLLKAAPQTTVFHAQDPASGRDVVLKLLNALGGTVSDENRKRFLEDMARLRLVRLPCLPELMDYGFTPEGRAFLVTVRREGGLLAQRKESPPGELLVVLGEVASCLAGMADRGLVHRNLSTSNIMVTPEGVLLLGLGSPSYLGSGETGALMGHSPEWDAFAAPELVDTKLGGAGAAWRADLYSAALVTCQVLGAEVEAVGAPEPVVTLPAGVRDEVADPVGLERVLGLALRRDPAARTLTLGGLAEALLTGGASAPGPTPQPDPALESAVRKTGETCRVAPPPAPAPPPPPPRLDPNQTHPAIDPAELSPTVAMPRDPGDGETSAKVQAPAPAPPEAGGIPPAPPPPTAKGPAGGPPDHRPGAVEPARAPEKKEKKEETERKKAKPLRPAAGKDVPRISRGALLVALGVLGLVVAVVVLGLLLRSGGRKKGTEPVAMEPSVVEVVEVREEPTVAPGLDPRLVAAQDALSRGDAAAARTALEGISAEEVTAFSEEERAIWDEVQQLQKGMTLETASRELEKGLASGSIRMIRRSLNALSDLPSREIAGVRGLKARMARAREILRTHTLMWRAKKSGDDLQVIERANVLIRDLPTYSGALKLREEAARNVETRAAGMEASGDLQGAIALLERLRMLWPDRQGLSERIQELRRKADRNEKLERILTRAEEALKAGDPERGLEILGSATPTAPYEGRFASLRTRLEKKLRAMDEQAPKVVLDPSATLRFKKNQTLAIPFQVTDDLGVASVKAMVRRRGEAEFREIPLEPTSGGRYVLLLTPAIHGNTTVEFWVLATDRSGHTGLLGTHMRPLKVLRKKWFQK